MVLTWATFRSNSDPARVVWGHSAHRQGSDLDPGPRVGPVYTGWNENGD